MAKENRAVTSNFKRWLLLVAAILIVTVAAWRVAPMLLSLRYSPPPKSYQGSSKHLARSVVVATLDSPAPEGKNVIWCASFQLAWNRLRSDLIGEPPMIAGAETVCDRLNGAAVTEADIPADAFYAAAGRAADGVVKKIQREMAEKFPDVTLLEFETGPDWIHAYACLKTAMRFATPYTDCENPQRFRSSDGTLTPVTAFRCNEKARSQIEILYSTITPDPADNADEQFILDLDRTSSPCQLILACIPRQATLAETLASLDEKIAAGAAKPCEPTDTLIVPNLNWTIEHDFAELAGSGKRLTNPGWEGYEVVKAWQSIDFRLDRSGAVLESQALISALACPRAFEFNRPFLICMKKRGAARPFFVMWVDNTELLCKPDDAGEGE